MTIETPSVIWSKTPRVVLQVPWNLSFGFQSYHCVSFSLIEICCYGRHLPVLNCFVSTEPLPWRRFPHFVRLLKYPSMSCPHCTFCEREIKARAVNITSQFQNPKVLISKTSKNQCTTYIVWPTCQTSRDFSRQLELMTPLPLAQEYHCCLYLPNPLPLHLAVDQGSGP